MAETAGREKDKKSFFKGLKAEFDKVIWPTRELVGRETAVVVACSVVLGLIIALLDLVIKFGLSFIL